jgi:DNA-binding CsgD family transcriptional regulator
MARQYRSAVASGWILVGRREQLALIDDARIAATAGGVVIHGPAGVGKSRLADEALTAARHAGWRTGRATASATAGLAPLGALAHLLPSEVVDARADPVTLYATVAAAFADQATGRQFVLMIDDLPRLDATSRTLVGQLLDASAIFLIATARTGDTEAGFDEFVRREHLLRVDLEDLTETDVDTLLHLALHGPVDPATAASLWRASRGNPLILRELVLGAQSNGRLVESHGVWGLIGTVPTTPRLVELVESRLAAVSADARHGLEMVALRSPIGLSDLQNAAGASVVDEIDRAGLIVARTDGRRVEVDLAHSLYGEVLRERLTPLVCRRLLLDHATRVEAHGARRREDPLFVATSRLDAGAAADPASLGAAMRLARYGHDHRQVVRLGRAAEVDGSEPALLLAEAFHELGSYDEAEQVLAGHVPHQDIGERVRLELAAMRVRNLVFGLRQPDAALRVLTEARTTIADPIMQDELTTDEAIVRIFSGRPLDALDVLATITHRDDPRTGVLHNVAATLALIAAGRCDTATELARTGYRSHVALGDTAAIAHPAVHVIHRVHALVEAGQLDQAEDLSQRAHDAAIDSAAAPIGRMWFAFWSGRVALLRGRPRTARRWIAEAAAVALDSGYHGQRRLALSFLITACVWLEDRPAAVAALADLDALEPWAYYQSDQEIGRAWAALIVDGNPARARQILSEAAEWAGANGNRASEARVLHDIARLGDPAAVRTRLDVLAGLCEGLLVPAYAAHAGALADRSADRLRESADRFESLGATLLAAEATVAAAHAHQRDGRRREATALLGHATELTRNCEGAHTPGLVTSDALVPLTERELEIASLAAERLSSREIAERLYLSARTVDNHLQRIYAKLGVSGRAQLGEMLRPVTSPAGPPPRPSSPPP